MTDISVSHEMRARFAKQDISYVNISGGYSPCLNIVTKDNTSVLLTFSSGEELMTFGEMVMNAFLKVTTQVHEGREYYSDTARTDDDRWTFADVMAWQRVFNNAAEPVVEQSEEPPF